MSHSSEKEWLEQAIPILITIEAKLHKAEKLTKQEERNLMWFLGLKKLRYEERRYRFIKVLWGRIQSLERRLEQLEREGVEEVRILEINFTGWDGVADVSEKKPDHPEEMKTMNRRLFEEMIAELFDGFGFKVELTKKTRDGGRDIIAIMTAKTLLGHSDLKTTMRYTHPEIEEQRKCVANLDKFLSDIKG